MKDYVWQFRIRENEQINEAFISQIQLDAFKAGMDRAAKIVKNLKDDDPCEPVENILFAVSKIVTTEDIDVFKG
jgi:hypothetical protein